MVILSFRIIRFRRNTHKDRKFRTISSQNSHISYLGIGIEVQRATPYGAPVYV